MGVLAEAGHHLERHEGEVVQRSELGHEGEVVLALWTLEHAAGPMVATR